MLVKYTVFILYMQAHIPGRLLCNIITVFLRYLSTVFADANFVIVKPCLGKAYYKPSKKPFVTLTGPRQVCFMSHWYLEQHQHNLMCCLKAGLCSNSLV